MSQDNVDSPSTAFAGSQFLIYAIKCTWLQPLYTKYYDFIYESYFGSWDSCVLFKISRFWCLQSNNEKKAHATKNNICRKTFLLFHIFILHVA